MPKSLTATLATVYGSVAEELRRKLGDSQAAQMGPPLAEDIEPAGDAERVRAWNARNPRATDAAMLALAAERYAEHRASGLPEDKAIRATAEDLTHFRYGQRVAIYTYGQVDVRSQVAEAQRMKRLAARETTPDPEPPPPTMPSAEATVADVAGDRHRPAPPPGPPWSRPAERVPGLDGDPAVPMPMGMPPVGPPPMPMPMGMPPVGAPVPMPAPMPGPPPP